jgi:tricorn protease-like protein
METGQSRQVTGGMFNDSNPVFDHKGDYLYFVSDRSYTAPRYDDTGQTWIYDNTAVLLAVPLRADLRSPYLPTSDEETFSPDTKYTSQDEWGGNDEIGNSAPLLMGAVLRHEALSVQR